MVLFIGAVIFDIVFIYMLIKHLEDIYGKIR
jgi:hypothetical protein